MCQSHAHTSNRNVRGGGSSAVAETPAKNTSTKPSRAADERSKHANKPTKTPPFVPGINSSKLPPASLPAPHETRPADALPPVSSTASSIPKTEIPPVPAKPTTPPATDLLASSALPKVPVSTTPANNQLAPVTTVQDLLTRNTIFAQAVIPAGHSATATFYRSTIQSTLRLFNNFEHVRSFDNKDFNIYRNRSVYMIYLQCFPEEHVRFSNSTNFMSSLKGQEHRLLDKIYQKLIALNLATGDAQQDRHQLPRSLGRLFQ